MLLGESLLKGFTYELGAKTGKSVTFVVKDNDRAGVRAKVEKILKDNGVQYTQEKIAGSGFDGNVFTLGDLKYKILYKPLRSGGSGAGAAQTKTAECAQAVYCAVAQSMPGRQIKDAADVHNNYKKYSASYDVDENLSKIINDLGEDWERSSIVSAIEILKYLPTNNKYIFHRGSKEVQKISDKFTQVSGNRTQLVGVKFNINKWSPADIYAIKSGFVINFDESIKTLKALNDYMLKCFKDGTVIGISLKKVVESASVTKYNVPPVQPSMARYGGVRIQAAGSSKDVFSSKDIYLTVSHGQYHFDVQFRTFTPGNISAWQGEVKGSSANLGKIGGDVVRKMLVDAEDYRVADKNTVSSELKSFNQNRLKKMYELYKGTFRGGTGMMKEDEFIAKAKQQDFDKLLSKYYGLEVAYAVSKSSDPDYFCDQLLKYAMSSTDISGPFIKIS